MSLRYLKVLGLRSVLTISMVQLAVPPQILFAATAKTSSTPKITESYIDEILEHYKKSTSAVHLVEQLDEFAKFPPAFKAEFLTQAKGVKGSLPQIKRIKSGFRFSIPEYSVDLKFVDTERGLIELNNTSLSVHGLSAVQLLKKIEEILPKTHAKNRFSLLSAAHASNVVTFVAGVAVGIVVGVVAAAYFVHDYLRSASEANAECQQAKHEEMFIKVPDSEGKKKALINRMVELEGRLRKAEMADYVPEKDRAALKDCIGWLQVRYFQAIPNEIERTAGEREAKERAAKEVATPAQ